MSAKPEQAVVPGPAEAIVEEASPLDPRSDDRARSRATPARDDDFMSLKGAHEPDEPSHPAAQAVRSPSSCRHDRDPNDFLFDFSPDEEEPPEWEAGSESFEDFAAAQDREAELDGDPVAASGPDTALGPPVPTNGESR
jgi:hypothetical protein